jgi:hypothetical protein
MISRRLFLAGLAASAARQARADIAGLPSGLPVPIICGAGLDQVSIDIPPQFGLPAGGEEVWISPTGRDRGDGTFESPFETLQHAFDRPEPVIRCFPGRYAPANLYGGAKFISAPKGNVTIAAPGPAFTDLQFRRGSREGTFVARLPKHLEPRAVLFRSRLDAFGREERMPWDDGGWRYDAATSEISIHRPDGVNEVRQQLRAIYIDHSVGGGILQNSGARLAVGAGVTFEGVGILAVPLRGNRPTTILNGCQFDFAPMYAFNSLGGVSFLANVRAHASQYDAFNYGPDQQEKPNFGIEHNCHTTDAGDIETFGKYDNGKLRENNNGSSSHSSMIVRYGGLYEGSLGPEIADTWVDDITGQVSANYGVLTRSSRIGVGYHFFGGKGMAYLDRCGSEGQETDLLATESAVVKRVDSRFRTIKTASGAVVD